MKVKELIKLLEGSDPEALVVMSKDAEGNSYSPLAEIDNDNNVYVPETTWQGEIMLKELRPQDIRAGYEIDEVATDEPDKEDCVILWPTN